MIYEREYLPDRKQEEELEDVVRVLKGYKSEALDVPDDSEEPTTEGAPTGATSTEDTAYRRCVAATASNPSVSHADSSLYTREPGQPTRREAAGRLGTSNSKICGPVAATAEPGQPTTEEEYADYD